MADISKQTKYSYSRLAQYKNCPFAYDLKYNQQKYVDPPTLVTLLGTTIHHIEEKISLSLREGKSPNYSDLIDELYNINRPKISKYDTDGDIFGIKILQERFTEDYFTPSEKTGLNYATKVKRYIENIKRQELFLIQHPELEIFDVEHPFLFEYKGELIKGFIDRVLKYKGKNNFQIHDIKTRDRLFEGPDVATPLQHAIYGLAIQNEFKLETPPSEYFYDLVFLQQMQNVGTKGFFTRAYKQLDKIFDGIHTGDYHPNPSPLCYWCSYSNTNPKVTPEGASQCPYYSKWTPRNNTYEVMFPWQGAENNEDCIKKLKAQIMQRRSSHFVL